MKEYIKKLKRDLTIPEREYFLMLLATTIKNKKRTSGEGLSISIGKEKKIVNSLMKKGYIEKSGKGPIEFGDEIRIK